MSRRTGVRWSVSVKENPRGGWWPSMGKSSRVKERRVQNDYGRHAERIKATVFRYFGTCSYEAHRSDDMVFVKFRLPSMRKWMDGMIAMKKADKKRKQKWVPNEAANIGEVISHMLYAPYDDVVVEVWAKIDDTLPVEGKMTEQELEIIYGGGSE